MLLVIIKVKLEIGGGGYTVVVLCADCSFQRGGRVSTFGWGERQPTVPNDVDSLYSLFCNPLDKFVGQNNQILFLPVCGGRGGGGGAFP